jgi:hypothetical protein
MARMLLDMFKQLGGSYWLPPSPENSSAVKNMEAAGARGTLVSNCQTARCKILKILILM